MPQRPRCAPHFAASRLHNEDFGWPRRNYLDTEALIGYQRAAATPARWGQAGSSAFARARCPVSICSAPGGTGSAIVSVVLVGHVYYRRKDLDRWITDQYAQTATEKVG